MARIEVTKMTTRQVVSLMKKLSKEGKKPFFKTRMRKHFVVYQV